MLCGSREPGSKTSACALTQEKALGELRRRGVAPKPAAEEGALPPADAASARRAERKKFRFFKYRAVHSGERGCYRSNRKNYRIDRIELRKKNVFGCLFFVGRSGGTEPY